MRTLSSDYGARTVPGGTSRAAVSRAPDVVIDEAVLQLYPFSRHAAWNQDRSSPLFRLAHFIGTMAILGYRWLADECLLQEVHSLLTRHLRSRRGHTRSAPEAAQCRILIDMPRY